MTSNKSQVRAAAIIAIIILPQQTPPILKVAVMVIIMLVRTRSEKMSVKVAVLRERAGLSIPTQTPEPSTITTTLLESLLGALHPPKWNHKLVCSLVDWWIDVLFYVFCRCMHTCMLHGR